MAENRTGKILVLTSTFPRWNDDHEPRFVEHLCQELSATHSITVLAPHYPGASRFETIRHGERTFDVYRYRYFIPALQKLAYDGGMLTNVRGNWLKVLLVPFFLAALLRNVARLNRRLQFDAIHAHWIVPQGIIAAIYSAIWRSAPPFVVTSHGGDLYALRGKLFTAMKRWVLRRANTVTVVSKAMRDDCQLLGIDAERIRIAPMGVDLQETFVDTAGEKNGLVFAGRLVEKKGVTYLLDAMQNLRNTHPDLRLTVVGEGPDRSILEAQVARLRLQNHVKFVGGQTQASLAAILQASEIAVMPSVVAATGDQEGLGLVAIEAMGCGCAVVASDLPAIRDSVVHEKTGLLATPGSADDIARQIDRLLNDKALARSLAANARGIALQQFDWPVVGRRYAALFSELGEDS